MVSFSYMLRKTLLSSIATLLFSPCLYAAPDAELMAAFQSMEAPSAASVSLVPQQKKNWTVMIYMNARNELTSPAVADLREMWQTGSGENVSIVAEIGRIGKPIVRYHVVKGRINQMERREDGDMGNYAEISNFMEWSKKYFPAKNYMLIIWGHGSGWQDLQSRNKGISYDYLTSNFIKTAELGKIFKKAGPVDILLMNSCLMQSAEVLYELRDSAGYIISSQLELPTEGLDYDVIIRQLTPDRKTRTIAENIVKLAAVNSGSKALALSAVDSAALRKLPRYLNPVVKSLRNGTYPLSLAYDNSIRFGNGNSSAVDLLGLAEKLSGAQSASNAAALRNYLKNELIIANTSYNIYNPNPGGISIELPYPNQYAALGFVSAYPALQLSRDSDWSALLEWISTLKYRAK